MPSDLLPAWVELPDLDAGPMGRLVVAHPRIGPPLDRLNQSIMSEMEYLTSQECEMIAAVAARAQDCHF